MRALRPGDPDEIGGYQLRARLGSGGMGRVYLASTPGGRLVAVKVIRSELSEDDEFQERFRLEVRAARQVRGLYTAELLDADPDDIPPWLVTAFVPGPSLAEAVKTQGPVPHDLVPLLMAGVAEALLDIHAAGIVHRDLKAPNVLLSQDGPRVIDFGIAKALDTSRLTTTGAMMGSPECMTPEQVQGLPVGRAADVFSLGSLAAFAASGQHPFAAPNSAAMMYRLLNDAPVLDGIPPGLRELLEHCLTKDPDGRPSPAEVLKMCRALMPERPAVFPQSWRPPALGGEPDSSRAEEAVPRRDARPVFGRVRVALGVPTPKETVLSGTVLPRRERVPRPVLVLAPRPPTAALLMYGAAALSIAALVAGLATVPSLRATLGQQHPGATSGDIAAAVNLNVIVLAIRALTSVGSWLWAALDVTRGHRRARAVATVALAVSTLGLVSSMLGVSTATEQGLTLIGWLVGLAGVAVGLADFRRR
jgi:predicted Ser/Thr protein kinase